MSRTRWIIVGLGLGATAQRKADRAIRQRLELLAPDHLVTQGRDRLAERVQTMRASIGDAIDEGRVVKQQREADLRGERQTRPDVIDLVPRDQPVLDPAATGRRADDLDGLSGSAFDRIPPPVPSGRQGRQIRR